MRKITFFMLGIVFLGIVCGQAGPFSKDTVVTLEFTPAQPVLGSNFTVKIFVDLTGITGANAITASLGGFAIPVGFDNTRLKLTAVAPGPAPFSTDLVFTDPARANARGFVTVVNTQLATNGTPAGKVHAATLTFEPLAAGRVIFSYNSARTIREGSLASTYNPPNGGPDSMNYTDGIDDIDIGTNQTPYRLIYPVLISTDSDFMGMSVVNESGANANLTFRGYSPAGQLIQQQGVTNPYNGMAPLGSLEQYVRLAQNFLGTGNTLNIEDGWMEVESPVHNISGFFLLGHFSGGNIAELDGADVSHGTASDLIFPLLNKDNSRETELFAINPGNAAVNGTLETMNSNGTVAQTAPVAIPAKGIFQLSFPANTLAGDGYFRLTMAGGAKVVGFERFGNNQALACLNAQDVSLASNLRYAAHFASGNWGIRYFTELNVINPGTASATVTFRLINDEGVEVTAPVTQTLAGESQLRVLGHTLFGLTDPLTATTGVSGSVIIESDQGLVGSMTFGDAQNGKFLSSLPLLSTSSAKRELFLDHVAVGQIDRINYFTGIALANPSKTRQANINLELYDQAGNLVAATATPIVLDPGKRLSNMLGNLFGANFPASQFGGFVRITSDIEIFSFMLFGDNNLSFLAAVPVR